MQSLLAEHAAEASLDPNSDEFQEIAATIPVKPKKKVDIVTLIIVAVIVAGACIIAYPTFSDWWNSYHQTRAIAHYASVVEETDDDTIANMMNAAHAYNERLTTKANRYTMSDAEKAEYESILNLAGDGVIGYIQIARIGVNYPIYHGMTERVLQIAIGHLEGTSLPVGGPTTHAVVSGHRGLPRAKLFTDLDQLVEGDTFTITVLNETLTYEIDQIRIVLPSDLSELNFVPEQDYCTLITCTPYGINSHRMLVRGHRVDNLVNSVVIPAEAVQIPNYIAVPAVSVPMLFAYLLGTLIYYQVRGNEPTHEEVLEALRAMEQPAGDAAQAEQPAGDTTTLDQDENPRFDA